MTGLYLDFHGSVFDGGDFVGVRFSSGTVDFDSTVDFGFAMFSVSPRLSP